MKRFAALAFVSSFALACGSAAKTGATMPAASGAEPTQQVMPGDPKTEIDELDKQIEAQLATAGLATSEPAACVAQASCSAEPLGLVPRVEDATCKPAAAQTCTDKCTLSDSICRNADRICELAGKLGGQDAWANGKCQRGNESCKKTREQCCGCT